MHLNETKRKEVIQCLKRYWREVSEQFGECAAKATFSRNANLIGACLTGPASVNLEGSS